MKKSLLKTVPVPNADYDRIHEVAATGEDIRGVIAVQKKKLYEKDTLILNIYQVSGKNKRDISLLFRVFCQKDDYITLDMESGKWRTAGLLNLLYKNSGWDSYWWDYNQLEFLTEKDALTAEKTFRKFTGKKDEYTGRVAFRLLDIYQNLIKAAKLEAKHKKIEDAIDAEMEKFKELPDDYQTFVEKTLFADDNYMFYNRKKKTAYCTRCGWSFDIDKDGYLSNEIGIWNTERKIKHNQTIRCPYCNSLNYPQAKSENMGRKQLKAIHWSVLVQSHGEEVLVRYFYHTKDFEGDYKKPKYSMEEMFRTVHTKDKSTDYEWNTFKNTGELRWVYEKSHYYYGYGSPSEYVLPRSTMLYNTNLDEDLKGTCMEYSGANMFLNWLEEYGKDPRHYVSPWAVDQFFNSYRKYPWLEQLIKCNMIPLAYEMLTDCPVNIGDIKQGRTVCETLGITKNMFNILRKQDLPRYKHIQIMKYYLEVNHRDILERDFRTLELIQGDDRYGKYKKYIDLMRYTTLHKLKTYMIKQQIHHENDYFDYVEWTEKLGYDMHNEYNLFPRDFFNAHDNRQEEYMKFRDAKEKEQTKRFNKLLKKYRAETEEVEAMNLNTKGLFIRLPFKLEELKTEGECLHHCVGTYMDKVKKGETMIFFIRKIEEPDKPYYTLEWRGSVIQCRGFKNCDPTPEVKAFVKLFEEKMLEYEKEPVKLQRKAG